MNATTNQLVEHFFRHESANLVAVLTRAFGIRRIELIEDMVQSAMLEAMSAWKQGGIPDNPAGWIHRVARNRILDALRREQTHDQAVTLAGASLTDQASMVDQWLEAEQLPDSLLRMMFVCCHPTLERKTQIALTLKTLCGFGIPEIARGLLLPKETVKKRLQRGRTSLAVANIPLELPDVDSLVVRRAVVHEVLYLMFNEGYSTSSGVEPIRDDICEEAARLCHLLCTSPYAAPETKALLALQLFHAARLDARTDADGAVVLLEDQDRSQWDGALICTAQGWLAQSKSDQPTRFHLEAAIAMQHCIASRIEETDWSTIVVLYDRLVHLCESPVFILNRAIAMGQAGQIETAMSQLEDLQQRPEMRQYVLLDCALARMHELNHDDQRAVDCYLSALNKATVPHEKRLLTRKLERLKQ